MTFCDLALCASPVSDPRASVCRPALSLKGALIYQVDLDLMGFKKPVWSWVSKRTDNHILRYILNKGIKYLEQDNNSH